MERISKKEIIVFCALLVLMPLFVGSLFFVTPWIGDINVIDEGQLAAWANHMLLGEYMYKDIYITYGPFYVYPLYLIFKLFGPEVFYLRLFYSGVGAMFGVAAVVLFVQQFNLKRIVLYPLVALLFLVPGASIRQGVIFFTLWVLIKSRNNSLAFSLFAGVSVAITFLITPEAGVITGLVAGVVYVGRLLIDEDIYSAVKAVFLFLLGVFSVGVLFAAWAVSEGWFYSYVSVTQDILSSFSGMNVPNGKGFPNPLSTIFSEISFSWAKYLLSKDMLLYYQFLLFVISFLYIFVRFISRKLNNHDYYLFLVTITGYIYYYSLVGRSGNFFLALTPTLIILAYFANSILNSQSKNSITKYVQAGLLILISLVILRILNIFTPSLPNAQNLLRQFDTHNRIERVGPMVLSSDQSSYMSEVIEYVHVNTNESDSIFFLSNEPIFYLLTNRKNLTRYDLPYIAHTRAKRYELLQDFKLDPPKLVIYDILSWPVDEVDNKVRLPELMLYIKNNYKKKSIYNGRIEVYTKE